MKKTNIGYRKGKLPKRILGAVLTAALMLGTVSLPGFSVAVKADEPETVKAITGLGTGTISNPKIPVDGSSWRGSYVYYGNYGDNPIKYRVLSKSTSDFSGNAMRNTMLVDCDSTLLNIAHESDYPLPEGYEYSWAGSEIKAWLNGDEFLNKDGVFSDPERNAIASSTKASRVEDDGEFIVMRYAALSGEKIFLLDAVEATRRSYGYSISYLEDNSRKKSGLEPYWWLRSPYIESDKAALVGGSGRIDPSFVYRNENYVSPAFNIDLSSVIFSSLVTGTAGQPGAVYKLTLQDGGLSVSVSGAVTRDAENTVSIPYTITDNSTADPTQVSVVVVNNGTWTENGWSEGSGLLQYAKLNVESLGTSGTGTFTLDSSISGIWGTDYHVYLLAEDVNGTYETDYASAPMEIEKLTVNAAATGYEGTYDGQPHGINVTVSDPSAYTIKYGDSAGTCTQTDNPTITDVSDSPKTVYFKVEGGNYLAYTGSAIIKITSKPVTVSGIKAKNKVYDGSKSATLDYTDVKFDGQKITGLTVTATGEFEDDNAGTNKTVNISALTLSGNSVSNYTLATKQVTTTADISKADIQSRDITPPTAKPNLTYTGSAQELVNAGSVAGNAGTIYYAVTKVTDTSYPPSAPAYDGDTQSINKKWSTSIPTGKDAGIYYVWYKAVGDANHNNSGEQYVTVTVSQPYTPPMPTYYTISFDMGGHGGTIVSQSVRAGQTVTKPADPVAERYTFDGWYTDEECTSVYDFGKSVRSSFTLYAKWIETAAESHEVSFNLNGKEGTAPDTQTVTDGGKASRPADPTLDGFVFTGWFLEAECARAYDFDLPVNEDLILYARWEKKEPDEDFGIYFAELYDDPYDGVHYNAEKDRYEIIYTGAAIKPLISVTSKADGVLKEGIDYSVSYSNNKNYSKKEPATIKVSGKGFYKSKKMVFELHILQADLREAYDRGLIAGADELKTLSGKKIDPVMVYRDYELKSDDRDISNKNKVTADTTTDITGKGNFKGTLKDVKVKVISKDEQKQGAIKVNLKAGQHVYNGAAQKLRVTTEKASGELTVTAGSSKTPLAEGTDFVVSYSGNTSAGKATVAVTGIGEYNGTEVRKFTIQPDMTSESTPELSEPAAPVYFNVRGAKPDITVTVHRKADGGAVTDVVLTESKDYKVSYSSNKKVGDGAYTVRFLGNYKGHEAVKGSFKIVQAVMDEARVEAAQLIYKNPGKYLSKPFVSVGGVQLKTSDYTFKYYEGDIKDVTAEGVKELTSRDKLELAGGEDSKTVTIAVTARGNYTGTALGTYEVVRRGADSIDLTKAKIVAKDKNRNGKDVKVGRKEYTGYAIEPEIRVMVKVDKVWTDVDSSLYEVSYINNVNKGKAVILVNGDGTKTIGSKKAGFSITNMNMNLFKLLFNK